MSDYKFYVVTGMPIDKVQQYKEASPCQQRYAKCFDANNNGIFDQKEVDLFNATIFNRNEKDNTVSFNTQVLGLFRNKTVTTQFEDNPDAIQYNADNDNLKKKVIAPYHKTHGKITGGRFLGKTFRGVSFEDGGREKEYSEVYYNNKYMNIVKLEDGTKVIYQNEQGYNAHIKITAITSSSLSIGYTPSSGWTLDGSYSPAGNFDYKIATDSHGTGRYNIVFQNLKNAAIIGSNGENRYQLENCSNCEIDISQNDNSKDKVLILNGKNINHTNKIKQNKGDATRVKIRNDKAAFNVEISGKSKINTKKINDDCKDVYYKAHWFKPMEWHGIKNNNIKYEMLPNSNDIYHWK